MKDTADTQTLELTLSAKKRGRPSSGTAMTPAERKRAQRMRDRHCSLSGDVDDEVSLSGLLDLARRAVAAGWPEKVEEVAAELVRRARENDE